MKHIFKVGYVILILVLILDLARSFYSLVKLESVVEPIPPVVEEVEQEEVPEEVVKQEAEPIYTLVQDDDSSVVYVFKGILDDFVTRAEKELQLVGECGGDDLQLTELLLNIALDSSVDSERVYKVVTEDNVVICVYRAGKPSAELG